MFQLFYINKKIANAVDMFNCGGWLFFVSFFFKLEVDICQSTRIFRGVKRWT